MGPRTTTTARTPLVAVTAVAALLAGALLGALVGVTGAATAGVTAAAGTWRPPGDTITRVVGDAANGFTIHHHDGSRLHPPTDSESMAECGEYDTTVARVRCRTEVRTWYRDLADTKRAIRWARYDARR